MYPKLCPDLTKSSVRSLVSITPAIIEKINTMNMVVDKNFFRIYQSIFLIIRMGPKVIKLRLARLQFNKHSTSSIPALSVNFTMRNLFSLLALQLIVICSYGQKTNGYAAGYFISGKDTLPYRYLQPLELKEGKKYPVIIVLHGTGERGTDNKRQLVHGAKEFMDSLSRKNFPAYII